jgi:hypothetical protein
MPIDELEKSLLELTLEDFALDEDEKLCEWQSCGAPAEYWLICPVCGSREYQCGAHSSMIRNAPVGPTVVFDRSCQHHVQQYKCKTEKI